MLDSNFLKFWTTPASLHRRRPPWRGSGISRMLTCKDHAWSREHSVLRWRSADPTTSTIPRDPPGCTRSSEGRREQTTKHVKLLPPASAVCVQRRHGMFRGCGRWTDSSTSLETQYGKRVVLSGQGGGPSNFLFKPGKSITDFCDALLDSLGDKVRARNQRVKASADLAVLEDSLSFNSAHPRQTWRPREL